MPQFASAGADALRHARQTAQHYLAFAFFNVFVNLLMLTGPLFVLQIYDRVLGSRSEETLVALALLVTGLYGLIGCWISRASAWRHVMARGCRPRWDGPVFQTRFTQRPGKARTTPENGALDVEAVQGLFASPAVLAIMNTPFTPLFIFAIFLFHPWLGWLAVTGGGVLVGLTLFNQWLTGHSDALSRTASQAAHRLSEDARHASDIIRAQGMLAAMTERWISLRAVALEQSMTAIDRNGGIYSFTKAFRLALQSLMLALGAWLVLRGQLTAGAMIAASILLGRALSPIESVLARWPQIARARAGWQAHAPVLDSSQTGPVGILLPKTDARLQATNLTVRAGTGRPPLLANLSVTVAPGEALGVIGRSGSGKTTLARARFSATRYFSCWTSQIRHSTWRAPMR